MWAAKLTASFDGGTFEDAIDLDSLSAGRRTRRAADGGAALVRGVQDVKALRAPFVCR